MRRIRTSLTKQPLATTTSRRRRISWWLYSVWTLLLFIWLSAGLLLIYWNRTRSPSRTSSVITDQHDENNSLHPSKKRLRYPITATQIPSTLQTPLLRKHTHVIPNVLIFTYSKNLLDPNVRLDNDEEVALRANVQDIIQAHNDSSISSSFASTPLQVRFLTNDDCLASIRRVLGDHSPLAGYFQQEPKGMFRADICRGAALYETGGLYFDVDVGLVHYEQKQGNNKKKHKNHLWNYLQRNTTFCTVLVHELSKHRGNFFQAFIASTPRNPIMYRYLELFIEYYQSQQQQQVGGGDAQGLAQLLHRKPLGVILLRMAYDDVMNHPDQRNTPQAVELWQEVLYHPSLFPYVRPPAWGGMKRACHFVVAVPSAEGLVKVPLYSRIAGSRQCQESQGNQHKHHRLEKKQKG